MYTYLFDNGKRESVTMLASEAEKMVGNRRLSDLKKNAVEAEDGTSHTELGNGMRLIVKATNPHPNPNRNE